MHQPRLLVALLSIAAAASSFAADLAQADEQLVRRLEANPGELAAAIDACQKMGLADAVGSTVCVSAQEVRYRRERNVIRSARTVSAAGTASTMAVVAQNASLQAH